jgi:hypothetical protein
MLVKFIEDYLVNDNEPFVDDAVSSGRVVSREEVDTGWSHFVVKLVENLEIQKMVKIATTLLLPLIAKSW